MAAAQTRTFPTESRVHFNGHGAARIGMSRAGLEMALGEPLTKDDVSAQEYACEQVHRQSGDDGISYMLINGRLARIDVDAEGVRTVSGIGIGGTESEVEAAYPGRITLEPHAYNAPVGNYLTLLSDDRSRGIRFETDAGKVFRYYVGTAKAIQYIEGCL